MAKKPYSTYCPACGAVAKLHYTERYSNETRFKKYRCSVLECGMTFVTSESLHQIIIPSHLHKKEKPMKVHMIRSLESFDNVVHNEPSFVLFTAPNCPNSKKAMAQFESLAKIDTNYVYLAVDPTMKALPILRHRYSISKLPTLLFIYRGNFSKMSGCDEILQYLNNKD